MSLGLILALRLTWANLSERAGAFLLFTGIRSTLQSAEDNPGRSRLRWVNFLATSKQLTPRPVDVVFGVLGIKGFQVVPKRWIVERTFGWWAFHRRLAKDY